MGRQRGDKQRISAHPTSNLSEPRIDRWRVPGFAGLELHHGSNVTQSHPRHWHEELYVCATLSGASYLQSHGGSLLISRETLAIVAPGDIHANRKVGCTFRCLFLESHALQGAMEQFFQQKLPSPSFPSGLIDDRDVVARFLKAHRSLETDDPEMARADFFSFLAELATRHNNPEIPLPHTGNEAFAVRQTKQFLDDQPLPQSFSKTLGGRPMRLLG